jgi:hypothetical protein
VTRPRCPLAILGLATTLLLTAGCTSVSWTDSSGTRHHLGLLAVRTYTEGSYTLVDRWSVGLDVRTDDEQRGVAVGLSRRRSGQASPRAAPIRTGINEYLAFLRAEERTPPAAAVSWRFLYHSEPTSSRAQWLRYETLGLDLADGAVSRGLAIGLSAGAAIDATRLDSRSVLAARRNRDGVVVLRVWRLLDSD